MVDLREAANEYKEHAVNSAAQEVGANDPAARYVLVLAQLDARRSLQKHVGPLSSGIDTKSGATSVLAAGVDKAALKKLEGEQKRILKDNPHMANWPDQSPAYKAAANRLREFKVKEAQGKVGRFALQLRWLENELRVGSVDATSQEYKGKRCKIKGGLQNALHEVYVWSAFDGAKAVKYTAAQEKGIYQGNLPWEVGGRKQATAVNRLYYGKRALPLLEERDRTFEEARLLKAEAIRCLGYLERQVSCLEAAAASAPLDSGLSFVLDVHLSGAKEQLRKAERDFYGWGSPPPVVAPADIPCRAHKCGKVESAGDNPIIFCDGCDSCGWHMKCAGLEQVPRGAWFCPDCERGFAPAGEQGSNKRKADDE